MGRVERKRASRLDHRGREKRGRDEVQKEMKEEGGSIERWKLGFRQRSRRELRALRERGEEREERSASERRDGRRMREGRTGRHLWTGHILRERKRRWRGKRRGKSARSAKVKGSEVELKRNEPRTSS